jgi:hypothetical protein
VRGALGGSIVLEVIEAVEDMLLWRVDVLKLGLRNMEAVLAGR